MPNDISIAKRCRDMGLRVIEVAGWQNRGRPYDFHPAGSVNHHTAGGSYGATPSLNGVIHGFAGSAPGPLANALQSREPDGNDIIYIIAAGTSNHAGVGGWRGLSGNSSVIGLEIEHVGTVPLPVGRQRIAARFHAAMAKGRWGSDMVCQHREWNPANKIDAATQVDPNQFRNWVAEALESKPPAPEKKGGAMQLVRTKSGKGYWICASDGGVFAYGEAKFYGSMGDKKLNAPISGMAATPSGKGYVLCAEDGGIFAFGDAKYLGGMGDKTLNAPIVDVEYDLEGDGYWLLAQDGGVFTFGKTNFYGAATGKVKYP